MAETIVVATGNPHKVSEIEAILAPVMPGVEFKALGELGDFEEPVEDGDTFLANALIKARAAARATGLRAVADDSGLVVDALGGAPGIHSARWCGHHGDDAANNAKLVREMRDVPAPKRTARFHSCVVLVDPACDSYVAGEGDCEGAIGFEGVGEHGFGYDPFFLPQATPGLTMAQLVPEQKNAISHRFKALQALAAQL